MQRQNFLKFTIMRTETVNEILSVLFILVLILITAYIETL